MSSGHTMVRLTTCIIVMLRCRSGHALVRLTTCIIVLLPMESAAYTARNTRMLDADRRNGTAADYTISNFIGRNVKTDCYALSAQIHGSAEDDGGQDRGCLEVQRTTS